VIDWSAVETSLNADGFARIRPLLEADSCRMLASLYDDEARFRSRIDMSRFQFGAGEYKYFAAPLPPCVHALREELYAGLSPIANRWVARLKPKVRLKPDTTCEAYEPTLDRFLARCHAAGQTRPTPLLLRYTAGGYNCLHQDLYGSLAFPLQVVFALSRRDADYTGGEFLLVEQRPRAQSRGHALTIEQGAGIVFATAQRPVAGSRGDYRVVMRHGVSTVASGIRMTLGVIFHDAR
jgi:hypothetical protein